MAEPEPCESCGAAATQTQPVMLAAFVSRIGRPRDVFTVIVDLVLCDECTVLAVGTDMLELEPLSNKPPRLRLVRPATPWVPPV